MFKTFNITALATLAVGAFSLTAETGVSIIAPGLNVGLADAADFTGRIRHVRIKRKRVGSGFNINAQTTGNGNGNGNTEIASAKAVLTDADGSTIESVTLGTAFHGTVVASTTTTEEEMGDSITITLAGDDLDNPEITVALKKGKGEGASADGWKAKATLNPQGTLRVVVMHEDRDWDGSALTGVSVTGQNSEALAMDVEGNDQTLQATLSTDLDAYSLVTATITLFDADGVEIESASDDFEFEGAGVVEDEHPLDAITITSTETTFSLTTWTYDDGTDLALEVDLVDLETGESALMTVDDTPILDQQSWAVGPLEFQDTPDGSFYVVHVDATDVDGNVQGTLIRTSIEVPESGGEDLGTDYVLFEDRSGVVGLVQDDTGIYAHIIYEGEKPVQGLNIIFEEPYEGPAPLDASYSLELVSEWNKWVQTAEGAPPNDWELTLTVTTAEGEVVETTRTTGSGDGSVYQAAERGGGVFPTSLIKKAEGLAGR